MSNLFYNNSKLKWSILNKCLKDSIKSTCLLVLQRPQTSFKTRGATEEKNTF